MHGWVPQYALLLLIRFMYVMFRREKGASWSNGYGRSLALQRYVAQILEGTHFQDTQNGSLVEENLIGRKNI